jgi:hypothetical protein
MLADTNEGYPSMDTIAKARGGYLDAKARGLAAEYGEVRSAQALDVARAIATEPLMPEALQAVMWAQYVVRCPSKTRALVVGQYLRMSLTIPEYWRNVDRAHYFLAARLEPKVPRGTLFQQLPA